MTVWTSYIHFETTPFPSEFNVYANRVGFEEHHIQTCGRKRVKKKDLGRKKAKKKEEKLSSAKCNLCFLHRPSLDAK